MFKGFSLLSIGVVMTVGMTSFASETGNVTFAGILLNEQINAPLVSILGEPCSNKLTTIYKSGQSLQLDAIKSKLKSLSEAPTDSEGSHFDFFHYTPASEVPAALHPEIKDRELAQKIILKEGGYNSFLQFIRTRNKPIITMALSVSSEWESAKDHGPRLVSFTFSPQTKVFDQNDFDGKIFTSELNQKFPGLTETCDLGNLYYFALDDSGAEVVDFHGDPSGGHKWFQVITFKSVTASHVLN